MPESAFKAKVNEAIDALTVLVFDHTPSRVPTLAQARLLHWLTKCLHANYPVQRVDAPSEAARQREEAEFIVREDGGGYHYPPDPYRAPPFRAPVHMPDGSIQMWGKQQLTAAGAMYNGRLNWGVSHWGEDMHLDPVTGRIRTVQGPRFNRGAYEQHMWHY